MRPPSASDRSDPVLGKIHILPLSEQANQVLFSKDHILQSQQSDSQSSSHNGPIDTPSIITYLSTRLVCAQQNNTTFVVELFESFEVNSTRYVVVDLEATDYGKASKGIVSENTSIYTSGDPIKVLTSLKLYLLRPFAKPATESKDTSKSTTKKNFRLPIKKLARKTILRHKNVESTETTSASSSNVSNNDTLSTTESNFNFFNTPTNELPLNVKLGHLIGFALKKNPSIVFIKGRELYLPCPNGLAAHIPINPWKLDSSDHNSSTVINQNKKPRNFLRFLVANTGDSLLGVFGSNITNIDVCLSPIGEFERVQISPIIDTIPHSYDFDFFSSYVKPYLESSQFKLFYSGDLLAYHGVQFKVLRTIPAVSAEVDLPDKNVILWSPYKGVLDLENVSSNDIFTSIRNCQETLKFWKEQEDTFRNQLVIKRGALCCRIGQMCRVYLGEARSLNWVDFLPQNVIQDIQSLPTRLQPFALLNAIRELSHDDVIRVIGWSLNDVAVGYTEDDNAEERFRQQIALEIVSKFSIAYNGPVGQPCIVCLENLEPGVMVLELPCTHTFHGSCVEQWLKRSLHCPVCKRDISTLLNINN